MLNTADTGTGLILQALRQIGPMRAREIAETLRSAGVDQYDAQKVGSRLSKMAKEGRVRRLKPGVYEAA